jgi:hypothetical protein
MLTKIWNKIKAWTGWSEAGSIFLSRLEAVFAIALGSIQGMDWTALMNLDFTNGLNKPVLIVAGLIFAKAVIQEIVRRRNTKDF